MKATLQTETGSQVGTAVLPPFKTPPAILIWGDRVFQLTNAGEPEVTMPTYRESFAVAVVSVAAE
jgi:hypothetical protein